MDLGLSHCAQWLTVYPLIQVIFFLLSPFCQVLLFSCNSMAKFTYANSCHSFNSLSHLNVCIVQYLLSCLLQTGFLCCKLIKADCWHTKCMQEVRVLQRCPDFFYSASQWYAFRTKAPNCIWVCVLSLQNPHHGMDQFEMCHVSYFCSMS